MMKSLLKRKTEQAPVVPTVSSTQLNTGSQSSLANNNGQFIPGKTLIKPADQLALSEKELDEEVTRILNANNPHAPQNIARYNHKERSYKAMPNIDHLIVHFEYEGYMIYKGDLKQDEEQQQLQQNNEQQSERTQSQTNGEQPAAAEESQNPEEVQEKQKNKTAQRNQFNYSERAIQTLQHGMRDRATNTEPPPLKIYSNSVNQWVIYDAYVEDLAQKERNKDKVKAGKKEDANMSSLHSAQNINTTQTANQNFGMMSSDGQQSAAHEDFKSIPEVKKAVQYLERMCNQNTYDDVILDYKFWDDQADEFREGKGVLLPLWKFQYERDKKRHVTCLSWHPTLPDFFAVGFGSFEFTKQPNAQLGSYLVCYSLKNPSYPDILFHLDSGVMCCAFHPDRKEILAAGLYDGNIVVFDFSKSTEQPVWSSYNLKEKHSDPVWEIIWQKDDLDEHPNFMSVSTDGKVALWTLLKTNLSMTAVIEMRQESDKQLKDLDGASCFDLNPSDPEYFIVGTDSGKMHLCSKSYNQQYIRSFTGHNMAVYALKYNLFCPDIFISCSADWSLKIWHQQYREPVMTFDLGSALGDVQWSPFSAGIFACVSADGKVTVFNLLTNRYDALCDQYITKSSKLTRLSFHPKLPIVLVGEESGRVVSLKLSPNLRGRNQTPFKQMSAEQREEQKEKLLKVIYQTMGLREDGGR